MHIMYHEHKILRINVELAITPRITMEISCNLLCVYVYNFVINCVIKVIPL